jgi:hypothetical protein
LTFVGIVKWLELSSAQWGWQIWWIVWIWVGAFIMRAAFNKRPVVELLVRVVESDRIVCESLLALSGRANRADECLI